MLQAALPILSLLADTLLARKTELAKQTGLPETAIGQVGAAVSDLLTRDERAAAAVMAEIDKARQHDIATDSAAPPVVVLLRGLVRPVITLAACFWYIFARLNEVPLQAEDYAIIGGIMAFWFGFRPFEKGLRPTSKG
ncbi:MAG: hypothetical protein INF43_03590 [Alphaproteobacteria bacterium]|nr:hypothetical protein [Alphaproteobacteria bacterium]